MTMALRRLRTWCAAGVCALMAACTSVPETPLETDATAFSRDGRFAVTVTEVGGQQQAVQGGFNWHDDGSRYRLDLLSPLGSIQARVEGRPGHATLTKADGAVYEAGNPDELAEEALGGPIPVSNLRDWMKGRVSEGAAAEVKRDEVGHPLSFVQDDWHATLSRYDTKGPGLLVLRRTEPGRRIVVRLAVDQP